MGANEEAKERAIANGMRGISAGDPADPKIAVGPTVLSFIAYVSEDEAISIADDSKYGLHAAILGTDVQCVRRVAS
jgi:hypothetical protein